ncbi:C6 transcription factor [Aspergillus luchuensis]|uniref:C6 transcription factor n=1 Tax=Aspergillus kawachii TaxID=1069201 RepID=A0A146FCG6_ASPKA|nr:C6 transcription factor [Aspergillus luchuensis]
MPHHAKQFSVGAEFPNSQPGSLKLHKPGRVRGIQPHRKWRCEAEIRYGPSGALFPRPVPQLAPFMECSNWKYCSVFLSVSHYRARAWTCTLWFADMGQLLELGQSPFY